MFVTVTDNNDCVVERCEIIDTVEALRKLEDFLPEIAILDEDYDIKWLT